MRPINPETSTRENPIKAHRISILVIEGLRLIEIIKSAKSIPTPIATPVRQIKGILEAKYLNPKSTKQTAPIILSIKRSAALFVPFPNRHSLN